MRERLRRARAYPYATPEHSFLQLGARTLELPAELDLGGREPLLAYGSNAAPEALARKLAADPDTPLPLIRAELHDFDAVYSAHLSPYGAVPATLLPSPGTALTVFVAYPTELQRGLLSATEPNYEERRLTGLVCRPERGALLTELDAFLSRHGRLQLDGSAVALSALQARERRLPAYAEDEVLERVHGAFFPGLTAEQLLEKASAAKGLPLTSS
jgi:hypothetical protein